MDRARHQRRQRRRPAPRRWPEANGLTHGPSRAPLPRVRPEPLARQPEAQLPHRWRARPAHRAPASAASPATRRSSRRPSRVRPTTTSSSARSSPHGGTGARPLLGDGARRTSTARSTCSPRCTTTASAATATSASRSTPASPTTARAPRPRRASCTERIDRPNLMVKIPGTEEGMPAIRQMIAEGRNINVTLIFCLDRYQKVMDAYIDGLEQYAGTVDADLAQRGQRRQLLHQPGRHRGRRPPRRHRHRPRRWRCAARPPSPRASSPTGVPAHVQRPPLGGARRTTAPCRSARCGPARPPRTRPTPTRCTSTRSSARTR